MAANLDLSPSLVTATAVRTTRSGGVDRGAQRSSLTVTTIEVEHACDILVDRYHALHFVLVPSVVISSEKQQMAIL